MVPDAIAGTKKKASTMEAFFLWLYAQLLLRIWLQLSCVGYDF
jgi:hypothetical protein